MRAKATKATAAQNMVKRASGCSPGSRRAAADKVASCASRRRRRAAVRRYGEGLSKSYSSLEVFTDVDLAIDRGSRVVVLG